MRFSHVFLTAAYSFTVFANPLPLAEPNKAVVDNDPTIKGVRFKAFQCADRCYKSFGKHSNAERFADCVVDCQSRYGVTPHLTEPMKEAGLMAANQRYQDCVNEKKAKNKKVTEKTKERCWESATRLGIKANRPETFFESRLVDMDDKAPQPSDRMRSIGGALLNAFQRASKNEPQGLPAGGVGGAITPQVGRIPTWAMQ